MAAIICGALHGLQIAVAPPPAGCPCRMWIVPLGCNLVRLLFIHLQVLYNQEEGLEELEYDNDEEGAQVGKSLN